MPGSHPANRIDGPPQRDIERPDLDGTVEVTAAPGDAVLSGHTYQWAVGRVIREIRLAD